MFSETNRYLYRTLTKTEQEAVCEAIRWLVKKRVKARQICFLRVENVDREAKTVEIEKQFGEWTIQRRIGYQGTKFEEYLDGTFPKLKSRDWLFPTSVWIGSDKPSFGSHIKIDGVENFIKNDRKKVLITLKKYSIIEVSTKRLHIQNQQMVGRR